jgi:Uma2 family endonuclease
MAVQEKLYTADDLLQLSAAGDSKRYELIEGRLIEMSPAGEAHGGLANEIAFLITAFVKPKKLGRVVAAETGFQLGKNPDTVIAPDVAFTSKARLKPFTNKFSTVAPDLMVEVESPGNSQDELHQMVVDYFKAGTRLAWFFYPKSRVVYVYRSPNEVSIFGVDDTLDGGDVLPGFSAQVKDIFAVLDT